MTDDQRYHVGDPIPYVLTLHDLMALTGYSRWQIDQYRRAHSHPGIVQLDAPGHPRFCGRAAKAWLENRQQDPARRYFTTARR